MKNDEIIKTLFLPIDAKSAWAYLTQPEKLEKWFHAPKTPLADGQDYTLFGRDSGDKLCWGKVTKMNPFSELSYTFSITPAPNLETQVHWILDELDGGTRITLRHTGLGAAGEAGFGLMMALEKGWDGHFAELRAAA